MTRFHSLANSTEIDRYDHQINDRGKVVKTFKKGKMIISFHAVAHLAVNCVPITWNLPISFGRFRQAERAAAQQELRPVTPEDLGCTSPSKEHRRRGKRYPDKAVTSHGPIYKRCSQFLEKSLRSALTSARANSSAAESQTDASFIIKSPKYSAEAQTDGTSYPPTETVEAQTDTSSPVNPPTQTAQAQTDGNSCVNQTTKTVEAQTDMRSCLNSPTETVMAQTDGRSRLNPPTETVMAQTDSKSRLNPLTETVMAQTDSKSRLNPPTETVMAQTDGTSCLIPPTETAVAQTDGRPLLNPPTETVQAQTDGRSRLNPPTETVMAQTDSKSRLNPLTETVMAQTDSKSRLNPPTETVMAQTDGTSCLNPPTETAVAQTDGRPLLNPPTETVHAQTDGNFCLNPPTKTVMAQTDGSPLLKPPTETVQSQTDGSCCLNIRKETVMAQTDGGPHLNPPMETVHSQTDGSSCLHPPTETVMAQTDGRSRLIPSTESAASQTEKVVVNSLLAPSPLFGSACGDAFDELKPAEKSVSAESYYSLASEGAIMEDDIDEVSESQLSTPAKSPWGSLEPEPAMSGQQNGVSSDLKEIKPVPPQSNNQNVPNTIPQASTPPQDENAVDTADLVIKKKKNGEPDLIGKGAFSRVYIGSYRGRHVAVKVTNPPTFRYETEGEVICEIGYHPYIVSVHNYYQEGPDNDMIETIALDCCATHLTPNVIKTISTDPALDFTAFTANCLMYALEHIHRQGYVHLDVSPGNVLLANSGVPKLADFSSSLKWKEGDKPLAVYPIGTVGFRAPEIIAHHGYDKRADFFSLGVLIYYMVVGRLPWERTDVAQMAFMESGRPGLEASLPEPFRIFLSDLLSDEPRSRISDDVFAFLKEKTALGSDLRR